MSQSAAVTMRDAILSTSDGYCTDHIRRGIKRGANSGRTVLLRSPKGVKATIVVAGRGHRWRVRSARNEQVEGSIPSGGSTVLTWVTVSGWRHLAPASVLVRFAHFPEQIVGLHIRRRTSRAACRSLLPRAVDVGAVFDTEHGDKTDLVVDLVQNAEGAPPRGVDTFELMVQSVADAVRILQKGASDELDDCCGDAFG
jgi:hypothetical protein